MKIHQYCMMCALILSQEAALEALRNGEDDVARMRDQYAKRRDFVVRRFRDGPSVIFPVALFMPFLLFRLARAWMKRNSVIVYFVKLKWRWCLELHSALMARDMCGQAFPHPMRN